MTKRLYRHSSKLYVLVLLFFLFILWEFGVYSIKDLLCENKQSSIKTNFEPLQITENFINISQNSTCKRKKVNVNVNNRHFFTGEIISGQLYVPFTFLKDYYEVSGDFHRTTKNRLEFKWSNIDPLILNTDKLTFNKYSTTKHYLNFESSNVANRARVKCICGRYEVPITTQWDANGYYYPTQIAQYGLSHISKYYAGEESNKGRQIRLDKEISGEALININEEELFILKITFSSKEKYSRFEVNIRASDGKIYVLRYAKAKKAVGRSHNVITHNIGRPLHNAHLTRDLGVDLVKGLSFIEGKKLGKTVELHVVEVINIKFTKNQYVQNLVFVDIDHTSMFMAAADWFIDFQDSNGGWPTNVSRVVFKGMQCGPGWYSAMGQGQAISLLSRVYTMTGKRKYMDAALNAIKVFRVSSKEKGVLAMLFGKYPWYEEYPVQPSLYVLNGFVYSLFGLYDLMNNEPTSIEAKELYEQGIETLRNVLPLFDNGHGSFYDLRHISIPGHSPNRARWQYHRVHLEQLYALYEITGDKLFNETFSRWKDYANGELSRHN